MSDVEPERAGCQQLHTTSKMSSKHSRKTFVLSVGDVADAQRKYPAVKTSTLEELGKFPCHTLPIKGRHLLRMQQVFTGRYTCCRDDVLDEVQMEIVPNLGRNLEHPLAGGVNAADTKWRCFQRSHWAHQGPYVHITQTPASSAPTRSHTNHFGYLHKLRRPVFLTFIHRRGGCATTY